MISFFIIAGLAFGIAYWISSSGLEYWRSIVGFLLACAIGWIGGGLAAGAAMSFF